MFSRKKKIPDTNPATEVEYNALHTARYQMCGVDDTVYNYFDRTSQCLPRSLSVILQNIQGFTTAPGLIERLSLAGFRGIDGDSVRHCIRDLHESGLLITKEEALARLRSANVEESTPKISTAAWITRNRPDSLIASIESFAANFRTYGHTLDFFVSDDSTDESEAEKLSRRLEGVAGKYSIALTCMGRRERRKLRDAILENAGPDGLPAAALDFALFGLEGISLTYGANRNAVLLACAGDMLLCSDDDVFCDLRIPDSDGYDLELATFKQLDVRETYTDRETLLQAHPPEAADILACHGRLLGRHVASILDDFNDNSRIHAGNLTPQDLTLLLHRGGEIKTTITGVLGDSGLISPRYQLQLRGEDREKHIVSKSRFRELLRSREIYQSTSHYTLCGSSFFWGMNLGIDNRTMLPPFLPVLRGEDITFSRLLKSVADNAMIGSLPVIIFHDPVDRRRFEEHSALNARPEMCYILYMLINNFSYPVHSDASFSRLNALGTHLADIGSLPIEDFEEHVRQLWLHRSMTMTMRIEYLLKEYGYKPEYWADYLEKYMISIRDHGYTRYITAARDLYTGDEPAAALSCREIVRQVGELLKWWPVIFNAAKDIRGNRRLAPGAC